MSQADKILQALREHGPMTSAEIASATDLPNRHVSAHMSALHKRGTVLVRKVLRYDDRPGHPAYLWMVAIIM